MRSFKRFALMLVEAQLPLPGAARQSLTFVASRLASRPKVSKERRLRNAAPFVATHKVEN
jgi:hypothetical protein